MFELHILHVVGSLGPGGAERLAFELAKRQATVGHVVSVATLSRPTLKNDSRIASERATQLANLGVGVHHVADHTRAVLVAAKGLRARNWASAVDVVHAHLIVGAAAARLGVPGRPPILWTLHSTSFGFPRRALALSLPFVDRYVGCSASVSVALQPYLKQLIATVANGIDLDEYLTVAASRKATPQDAFRMISVGSLRPAKNYTRLVNAAIHARALLHDEGIRLTLRIVGDGEMRGSLERLVTDCGAGDYIELLGARSDIPHLLAEADGFAISSDREGLPLALIEAMCAGLPSVVTPFEGASNVTNEGRTSLIAPDFTVEGLASAIVELATNRALRASIQSAALADASRYNMERCAREYECLYAEAVNGPRRRGRSPH